MNLLNKTLAFIAILLVGCSTTYQEEGLFTNGYSHSRTSENTFLVTFRANEMTPEQDVQKFVLQRSAEVTLEKGFRYFVVLEEKTYLHTPSLRLTIQCFKEAPVSLNSIDAVALAKKA